MADEAIVTASAETEAPVAAAEPTESQPSNDNGAASVDAPADPNAEIAALKALADKLGLELDDKKVTTKERARLRLAAKEERQRLDAEAQQTRASIEAQMAEHQERIGRATAILRAADMGDYQELARQLGHQDWDALQLDVRNKVADPNYKRLQELERKQAEAEAREQRSREQAAVQERASLQAREIARYKTGLSETMAASADPLVRAMHDDPNFVDAVWRIQREHYDPRTDSTVAPEQAIRMAASGARMALKDELGEIHKRLSRAFGAEAAKAIESAVAAAEPANDNAATKAAKPKAPPKPSASRPAKWEKKADWRAYAIKKLEEAAAKGEE